MSDPRKPLAEEAIADEQDHEVAHEDAGTDGLEERGADADDDDAGDDEPADGGEDTGDADEPSDDDGLEADGTQGRSNQAAEGRPVSRAQRRFQELSNRTRAAEERSAAIERELAQLRAERSDRQTREQREEEAERLRLMDPAERAEYRATKLEERFGQELGRLQFQQKDTSDRTRFEGLLARRPEFEKYADQVEAELAAVRRNGVDLPRETILYGLIGRAAVQKAPAARTRAAKKGAENIQRQTARPTRAGGDVQRSNARSGSESDKRRERLKDMQI